MDKSFSFQVGEEVINLEFNQAFGFKLAQYLGVKDPTVSNLATAMKDMLQSDGMLGIKLIICAGVYGYDFVNSDSAKPKYSMGEIGRLLLQMDDDEATRLIEAFYENLGLNIKAEPEKPGKKKVTRKKKN